MNPGRTNEDWQMTPSLTPGVLRSALAQAYPFKPWLWDRPFHFLSRRAILALLERFTPNLRDAQWTLTLGSGARMIASPRNAEARSIFTHGFSEYALAHLLGKMIGRDWICVDVGANQGEYTILTAQHATGGQVYAFEPVELIYDRLQANIRLNGLTNVTVTRSAVHRYDGTCSFYINRNPRRIGLSSLSPTDYFADAGMEEHTVPCVTLDSALSARQRVDLMKIDVEGHELDVLEGARSTLERCVPIIAFEFFTASRPYSTEAANYLVARNYNLYRVDYDPSHGAGLVPVTDLRLEALSSVHSPFEPINLVAVHPQKSDMVAELAKPPYSQRKDK